MITCDFYLNNRIKTITNSNVKNCWVVFINDFGEAKSELCKVKVYWDNETKTESHYSVKDFKNILKNENKLGR